MHGLHANFWVIAWSDAPIYIIDKSSLIVVRDDITAIMQTLRYV